MPTVPMTPPSVPPGPVAAEGVAAMIPVANITLEDALLDNPNFRANIKLFEGQVFFIESWLVALQRSMNLFTEEWKRLNEVTSVLNKRAEVPLLSQGMLSSQYTIPAMKLVGGAFRTTLALKNNYITEVNEKVLKPLDEFLKTDLKDFKESKKTFDKALEKYESTLAKYNGQSRQKEPSALREEAFQLYDTRKAYIQAAMACSMLCIRFQDGLDQLVIGVFLDLIATQHDYYSGNSDHFGSMALQVLQLKTYMKDHKEASAIAVAELEQNKERYTADAVEYWKPSRSLKCYSSTPVGKSAIGMAALGPVFAAQIAGQVPMSNLMTRPATISQISTAGTNRSPLPMQQFQSQPALAPILTIPPTGTPKSTSVQSAPLEPVSDSLVVAATLPRTSNSSSPSLPTSALYVNSNSSSMNSIYQTEGIDDSTPTTKQGYLNIRIPQPKNRAPVWQRKYFFIQEGEFGFESVVSNPTVGSQVVQSERIAVILCELRYGSSSNSLLALSGGGNPSSGSQGLAMVQMERRFCFEVVCATQSYLLQAETEDDLMSWVNTFEAAKRDVFLQQNFPQRPEPEEPYSPMVPDNSSPSFSFSGEDLLASASSKPGEDSNSTEISRPSGSLGSWAASVPGVSLLLGSYAGNNTTTNTTASDPSVATNETGENESGSSNQPTNQDTESLSTLPVDSPPASTQQVRDGPSPPPSLDTATLTHSRSMPIFESAAEPTEHTRKQSEIEKLMTSSLHLVPKAIPLATTDIPHYSMELVVRNRELHLRFHGTKVHSKEYVLHSWTSGYLDDSRPDKPIMVYGRIFLTQSGMYFYARGLSVETKRMYRFSTIRGIECEQKDISTEWRIETMDGVQHVFCQFTLTDTEYQVLHLIWTNVHQAKERLPVKELFRQTMQITNKPKGSAGSGSLAETESSHQTTRDGTLTSASDHGKGVVESPRNASAAASIKTNDEGWQDLDEDFPATIEAPSGPVSCNCPGHLEKLELEETFKVSAKTLNRLLFGYDSPVWKEFHNRRNNTVQSIGEWTSSGDKKTRVVKFLMVVNNPLVKLNQTDCVETHTCEVEEEHLRYSYTVKSSVLAMPYSDAFTPVLRYCITYVGKKECKLTCSSGIEWHKNPLVKAMIKGAILKCTAETVRDVAEILQAHLEDRKEQNGHAPGAGSEDARPSHIRRESSGIVISLNAPDDKGHSILLDPEEEANSLTDKARDRSPGARRHTVSTGAGSGGIMYSGPRVQGHWPTGAQPSFVPVGTKASRTRLLGRPSRATLSDLAQADNTSGKGRSSRYGMFSVAGLKKVFGLLTSKDEQERTLLSTRLLYIVLVVSSFINIWAALNSQRMLNSTWKLKEQGILSSSGGPLRGYPEPLHRVSFGESHRHDYDQGHRNVRVAARAVYLRDLEERMMSGELDSFDDGRTIDPKSFKIFLEIRDTFRPWPQRPVEWFSDANDEGSSSHSLLPSPSSTSLSPSPSASPYSDARKPLTVPQYPWLLPQHRRWATRIIFQRDRVGILRHDLLLTFEVLKQLEQRLLETEYVNWIMDERSRCRLWERRREKEQKNESDALLGTDDEGSSDVKEDELKQEFLRQLETDQGVDMGKVKEELLKHLDGSGETSGKMRQEQLTKAQVTKEFCQGLEHQVKLFMMDTKQKSSS